MTRDRLVFTLAGTATVAVFAVIAATDNLHQRIPLLLALYGVAFGAYAAGLRVAFSLRRADRFLLVVMLAAAVLARIVLVPARPDLSTDIYRYAWEGRVVLHGANPFSVAPADSSLVALRDDDYGLINHRHMATIYPPLAQAVFACAAWIHPGVSTLKVLFVLFDLATLALLLVLLRVRGRPPTHALVYAWSPLVILETGHSGHMDAIGVFFLILGIVLLERRRASAGYAALGASFLAKYTTVVLLPFLVARRHWRGIAIVAVVALAGYLPFLEAGPRLLDSLRTYGGTWWFNGPPYMALAGILGDPVLSRRLLAAAGVAFAVAAAFRERDIARYAFLVVGCSLLLAPTLYPWYLTWIVPFLCLYPSRAWIAFTGLVALSYWVWVVYGDSGAWILPGWVLALEYIPFYALLAWQGMRRTVASA
jgi:alpha-1,6-mannosyltransferase